MNSDECPDFELLISCDLDGELDQDEQQQVQRHLAVCPSCREWHEMCQRLVSHVAAAVAPEYEPAEANPLSSFTINGRHLKQAVASPKAASAAPHSAKFRFGERWFLGLAALVLLGIGISFGVFARRSTPTTLFSVEPLVAMHAINVQTEQDQQATLRTVEMELRMMKLEMKQMPLTPADREQMEKRIESLLTKTRQMDASTQVLFQGE